MSIYTTYTDHQLTDLLAKKNGEAFSEIYNRYWAVIFRHARRMTKDDDLAKDVVQDVFVSLWDKAMDIQLEGSLSSYLYATARNKILNIYDRTRVKNKYIASLEHFMKNGENITDHLLRERLLASKIEQEISLLPKKMRQVFEMSRKSNMTYKQIAENLNISDKTVKKQMSNAIKILRLKLGALFVLILALLSP